MQGSGTTVDVTNSVAETTLCSFVIPAAALGANGFLVLDISGDALQNAAINFTHRVKAGATVLWGLTSILTANAARHAIFERIVFGNQNAQNSNTVTVSLPEMNPGAADLGTGALGRSFESFYGGANLTTAVDTSASWTLSVSAQWASASASVSWRKLYAGLTIYTIS